MASSIKKNSITHKTLVIFLSMIFFFILYWAYTAKVETVTRAKGKVVTTQRPQIIQSSQDGVISTINVKEGQIVKKNQRLINLEQKQAKAALLDSEAKVSALRATLVRLKSEVFERPLVFPGEIMRYDTFVNDQKQLFIRRKNALDSDVNTFIENKKLVAKELQMAKRLLAQGDISQVEVLRLQRQIVELDGKLSERKNRYFQESQAEMTKVNEQLSTEEQILADRQVSYARTNIDSPVDGVISRIVINTNGARLRPGEIIMEVLPTGNDFIVEGRVSPADVGMLRKGLKASVKLDAYDYTIYGSLNGVLTYISPDAITEKSAKGEESYYLINVAISSDNLKIKQSRQIELQAGMTATIEIYAGDKTILQYILKPMIKTFSESFVEP